MDQALKKIDGILTQAVSIPRPGGTHWHELTTRNLKGVIGAIIEPENSRINPVESATRQIKGVLRSISADPARREWFIQQLAALRDVCDAMKDGLNETVETVGK